MKKQYHKKPVCSAKQSGHIAMQNFNRDYLQTPLKKDE